MRLPRRFDDALMLPPDALGAVDERLLASIRAWCEGGAFPALTEPLRVASIAPNAGLDAAASELDGSHALARLGRWPGLLWRLQLLWRECATSGNTRQRDPWDCGWWRGAALDAAQAFQPRRATLLMVRDAEPGTTAALVATLRANSSGYTRPVPVRVLVVSEADMPGIARL